MLKWVIAFFTTATIAGILRFSGIVGGTSIAHPLAALCLAIFLALTILALIGIIFSGFIHMAIMRDDDL